MISFTKAAFLATQTLCNMIVQHGVFYPRGRGKATMDLVSMVMWGSSKLTGTPGMQTVLRVCLGTSQACSFFSLSIPSQYWVGR